MLVYICMHHVYALCIHVYVNIPGKEVPYNYQIYHNVSVLKIIVYILVASINFFYVSTLSTFRVLQNILVRRESNHLLISVWNTCQNYHFL